MSDQSVVSVVALEIAVEKEADVLTLVGKLQALVRRKGYGTSQLLRDGRRARRYYDLRVWRNADAAAHAGADKELEDLLERLAQHVTPKLLVDVAWTVEMASTAYSEGDRRQAFERRIVSGGFSGDAQPDVVTAARIARDHAYATYSNFKVGAALETADGRIITGCNVENATYGLTMCAERIALYKAVSEGHRSFTRIAIVADTERPTTPCGACRQVLWEFGGNLEVLLADLHEVRARHLMADLLPHPFDAVFLE